MKTRFSPHHLKSLAPACLAGSFLLACAQIDSESSSNGRDTARTDAGKPGFDKTLELQGIRFHVQCPNQGSLNNLVITPNGLETDNSVIRIEADGTVTGAEVADLNSDGSPEIYVYVQSAGSGSYGMLIAYSANNRKSLSQIHLPELAEDKKLSAGYMGHDEFAIVENVLARRFPIYKPEDSNSSPSGGTRQIQYKLKPGEAAWQLYIDRTVEY